MTGGTLVAQIVPWIVQKPHRKGFDYGMELNLYKSHFLDCCPVVSGIKTKSFGAVS